MGGWSVGVGCEAFALFGQHPIFFTAVDMF